MRDAQPDGTTALAVLVPEADPVVGPARARHDPGAAAGMPAHVTVVAPFIPDVVLRTSDEERLASLFGAIRPFRAVFRRCARFGDATLYLAPEPGGPFIRLTQTVMTAYPAFPPYGGRFPTIVPHLTIADGADAAILTDVERQLPKPLRIETQVREVVLFVRAGDTWSPRRRYPLGG